jgi:UDP-N-acetylmuramoylalanine--D-glutamate ligase
MINTLIDKRVVVIGLGNTGLSALRWLNRQGAIVTMMDTRMNPPNIDEVLQTWPGIKVHTGPLSFDLLKMAELIVVSPGVSLKEHALKMAIDNGMDVVGDIELFARHRPERSKVIAITGSNGKTTVTTLTGEICKKAGLRTVVAGNIGLPILDTLNFESPDVYVLELSSFQLETTKNLKVDVATILNISQDHLDRYDDMGDYAKAKALVYKNASLSVINRDDAISRELTTAESVSFGLNNAPNTSDYGVNDEGWLVSGRRKLIKASELKIHGEHNIANALAAAAICSNIGIDRKVITDTLSEFGGLPHRVQWVATVNDVHYYDDSKGTNVGATCAAITGLPRKVILIAGGEGKGQDFNPLKEAVEKNARAVVLYGKDAKLIEEALISSGLPIYDAIHLKEAVAIASKVAFEGDAVLLSPACASFDMFRNYEHRAEVFVDAVMAIKESETC